MGSRWVLEVVLQTPWKTKLLCVVQGPPRPQPSQRPVQSSTQETQTQQGGGLLPGSCLAAPAHCPAGALTALTAIPLQALLLAPPPRQPPTSPSNQGQALLSSAADRY